MLVWMIIIIFQSQLIKLLLEQVNFLKTIKNKSIWCSSNIIKYRLSEQVKLRLIAFEYYKSHGMVPNCIQRNIAKWLVACPRAGHAQYLRKLVPAHFHRASPAPISRTRLNVNVMSHSRISPFIIFFVSITHTHSPYQNINGSSFSYSVLSLD